MQNLYPFVDVDTLLSGVPAMAGFAWTLLGVGRWYQGNPLATPYSQMNLQYQPD